MAAQFGSRSLICACASAWCGFSAIPTLRAEVRHTSTSYSESPAASLSVCMGYMDKYYSAARQHMCATQVHGWCLEATATSGTLAGQPTASTPLVQSLATCRSPDPQARCSYRIRAPGTVRPCTIRPAAPATRWSIAGRRGGFPSQSLVRHLICANIRATDTDSCAMSDNDNMIN